MVTWAQFDYMEDFSRPDLPGCPHQVNEHLRRFQGYGCPPEGVPMVRGRLLDMTAFEYRSHPLPRPTMVRYQFAYPRSAKGQYRTRWAWCVVVDA